eukprot:6169098-Pyramimonas_sp.AAC.1
MLESASGTELAGVPWATGGPEKYDASLCRPRAISSIPVHSAGRCTFKTNVCKRPPMGPALAGISHAAATWE